MAFLKLLVVFTCAVIVAVNLVPEDNTVEPLRGLLLSFDQDLLKSRFGDARSLDHKATRSVYHQVLSEAEKMILNSRDAPEQKALTCSLMRSEARRYARSRDGSYRGHLTDAVLQLRDSYVHGLRYLPIAMDKDIRDSLSLQRPTLYHVGLVVKQIFSCLAPALSSGNCPSYTFLREVRGKSDDEILGSCTTTNTAYDAF
ncbi:hypothetical protein ABB37_01369 [Leptomonas pyrrhocoris]|uniref:Uncharacterized protein n=1 Tax=Leptomonas pyrrhocoris TaxID=157538 RepID=A0A0N1J5B6_LEPPY|nr:hypothetical protein ABB37_01369 [Leptomonas pyrrhocoris]XP_015663357.1 hypothetical protein ABB37_01369 [Leptomonas pyrrhocoris]XP_015663358.1 hypothetical protein ABB37_01369 [Leptomonas pyrrhocoris]KPA84917.1 hypothetical protein ABB37_01369 [Leptomonas pyrrhocoris]KPA84918.1 hypothetical protein ABB37_01369 [Leptomonas pyrrhocoris]KPA84919.1 hypothetical protein ABB37_01369 [Leptomonas pyrrhocoris]|eukprot:XP_015663356.1 hypothetical protein ABB37_01369 [Leptomonas pyrrhocoris]